MAARKKHQPIQHLYVSIDTCAELGGQPYKVLEALHNVYEITGRRKLTAIDTVQGLFEKSEYISPDMMKPLHISARKFSQFVKHNADWAQIIETDTCKLFRQKLAEDVFPKMVDPLANLAEQTSRLIQRKAFDLLKEKQQSDLDGKPVHSPADIDIHIKFFSPEKELEHLNFAEEYRGGHYLFDSTIVSEAADRALPFWKEQMKKDKSLHKDSRKQLTKSDMAMMIKSLQESKAITHCLISDLEPEVAAMMGKTPEKMQPYYDSDDSTTLEVLRENSHLYGSMTFPVAEKLGALQPTVQAVRLTTLWPWAHKNMLSQESSDLLRKIHKNTADLSYLDMFTSILPTLSPPEDTLYILLSHDMPLRRQFLEVSTGISEHRSKKQLAGEGTYKESHIYENLDLCKRDICHYPHEAVLVGSEFAEFAYKEVVAALSPYITRGKVNTLTDKIRKNGPDNKIDVGDALEKAIKNATDLPENLKSALVDLTEAIVALEVYVAKDIQAYGEVQKNGRYDKQKSERLAARPAIFGM